LMIVSESTETDVGLMSSRLMVPIDGISLIPDVSSLPK